MLPGAEGYLRYSSALLFNLSGLKYMKRHIQFRQLVVLLIFVFVGASAFSKECHDGDSSLNHPVVVEAYGYATMQDGKEMSALHREALDDALRNAVVQAHVSLDVQARVEDMRLRERMQRSRSLGYVENSRMIEAGMVPQSDPPVYRLFMEAIVRPIPIFKVTPVTADPDSCCPGLVLNFRSDLSPDQAERCRESLTDYLKECGIRVVDPLQEPVALVANVMLAGTGEDKSWEELHWSISCAASSDPSEATVEHPVHGKWLVTQSDITDPLRWNRLGAVLAQDALRLWATPRVTEIIFSGCSEEQMQSLSRVAGATTTVLWTEDGWLFGTSLTGNPQNTVDHWLKQCDLFDDMRPSHISLTHLVYDVVPSDRSALTD